MAFGQGSTVLQYVIRGSNLYCGKIGDLATIEAEVKVAELVHKKQHCPSVMPVVDSIKIDEKRVVMIVPFYPIPVSHTTVNEATILNVALCGLATVKAFSNKGLCHGDIKLFRSHENQRAVRSQDSSHSSNLIMESGSP